MSSKSIKKHEVALFKNVSMNKEKQKEVEKNEKNCFVFGAFGG